MNGPYFPLLTYLRETDEASRRRAPLRQTLSGPGFLGISFDHRVNKLVQHQHHPGCCPSPLAFKDRVQV